MANLFLREKKRIVLLGIDASLGLILAREGKGNDIWSFGLDECGNAWDIRIGYQRRCRDSGLDFGLLFLTFFQIGFYFFWILSFNILFLFLFFFPLRCILVS